MTADSSRIDRTAGPNWLAVGDAATAFDPLASQGIYHALFSASNAARAILDRSASPAPFDAYAAEVARVDTNNDGIISAAEGDVDTASDGFPDNERLFLPATSFNRFAVTREINDGILAPRFAPSQRGWLLQGTRVGVSPAVPASAGRDSDDR